MTYSRLNVPNKTISDVLFFVSLGIFLVTEIIVTSFYYQYFTREQLRIVRYIWFNLLVLREFFIPREYNIVTLIKQLLHNILWLIGVVLLVVLIISTKFRTDHNSVFFIMIFIFCARNIDFKRIAKFSFWVILATVAFVIIGSYIGIVDNYVFEGSWRSRQFLGFRYCLYAPMYLFYLIALYLYIRGRKIKWLEMVFMVLINIWMYLQAVSRLAFIFSIVLILIGAFFKLKPMFLKGKRTIYGILIFSFLICFTINLILVLTYDESVPILKELNQLMGKRLDNAHTSVLDNGIHFLGHELWMRGNGLDVYGNIAAGAYTYVDCFYIQFLLRNGIIPTAIWLGLLTLTMYYFYRSENYFLMIILAFPAVGWLFDDLSSYLYFNIFWLTGAWFINRFMSQHGVSPKMFPGEDGKVVNLLNRIFSWRPLTVKNDKTDKTDCCS